MAYRPPPHPHQQHQHQQQHPAHGSTTPPSSSGSHAAHDSALSVGSGHGHAQNHRQAGNGIGIGMGYGGMGYGGKEADAARIRELEGEVRELVERVGGDSQRFADYENEIRVLQARLRQEQRRKKEEGVGGLQAQGEAPAPEKTQLSRFGSFIGGRKPLPAQPATGGKGPAREKDLEEAVAVERAGREAAERKVKEVNGEVEELSASLFQQANEMVAVERRENAGLREKVAGLEARVGEAGGVGREVEWLREKVGRLEAREVEKKRRLERLEAANRRIERVRSLLKPR